MALSNYDTLAFNTEGQPCAGSVRVNGITVEIYKNWIYVRDAFMENRKQQQWSFTLPTVMEVQSGNLRYGPWQLQVARGKQQEAVFLFARYTLYGDDKQPPEEHILAGIGCYAYMGLHGWLVENYPEQAKSLGDPDTFSLVTVTRTNTAGEFVQKLAAWRHDAADNDFVEVELDVPDPGASELYTGLLPSTVAEFMDWLGTVDDVPEGYIDKLRKAEPLRFNQGDAFFARHLGVDVPATPPGQSSPTVLSQLLHDKVHDESQENPEDGTQESK